MSPLKSLASLSDNDRKAVNAAQVKARMAANKFHQMMDYYYWNGCKDVKAVKPYFDACEAAEKEFEDLRARFNV